MTRNCVAGNRSPSMAMKGIVPPTPIDMPSRSKQLREASCTARSNQDSSGGAFQPALSRTGAEPHLSRVRRVLFESSPDGLRSLGGVRGRRQAEGQLDAEPRRQHVAGIAHGGQTVDSGHRERRFPGGVEQQLERVLGERLYAGRERHTLGHGVCQHIRRGGDLPTPLLGNLHREFSRA